MELVKEERSTAAKVILIGGAPFSGKSTVARLIACELGYGCSSADAIGQALRATTTPESHPELHPMRGEDHREYCDNRPLDAMMMDAHRSHEAMWPAIEAIIGAHATWSHPIVIEGWALWPDRVAAIELPVIASLWLIGDDQVLEARIRANTDHHAGASDEEAMMRAYVSRNAAYNARLAEAVARLGLPAIRVDGETSPQDLSDLCLSANR
jgi:2-phosphoglycerate kinase|tara:strand:+ start:2592 stop:3224 length:633 start_codon:yes stop_codon:yes gene_type:complete